MLPPVLEIFVIWHPGDVHGKVIANEFIAHFRGASFSGVIGGGVHVSIRSASWETQNGAPQPVYSKSNGGPNGIAPAEFVAFVPILGTRLAQELEKPNGEWDSYLCKLMEERNATPKQVGIFPYCLDRGAIDGTKLGQIFGGIQMLATTNILKTGDTAESLRCRDLSQGLAQLLLPEEQARLTVFISHTKRSGEGEGKHVDSLVELVRLSIANTRLAEFFDASDLQPGNNWEDALRKNSQNSALLAIRTDLYSSREWCQREVALAKCAGMPVVTLDAITIGEERGSFLMDHVPRIPVRLEQNDWKPEEVIRGLNLLTDECLKRAIWLQQCKLAKNENFEISWWASQAPEPLTLLDWLENQVDLLDPSDEDIDSLRILHPDPPLGPEERKVLSRLVLMSRLRRDVDIMTPRLLAARGG